MSDPKEVNNKPDREITLRLDCSDFGWEQTKNINKALMLGRCECGCPVSLEVMEGCPKMANDLIGLDKRELVDKLKEDQFSLFEHELRWGETVKDVPFFVEFPEYAILYPLVWCVDEWVDKTQRSHQIVTYLVDLMERIQTTPTGVRLSLFDVSLLLRVVQDDE